MKRPRPRWRIEPLDKGHDRAGFMSGAPELDRYLRELASQDVRRDVARVFVAVQEGSSAACGFYSLGASSFRREKLPAAQAKRLPHYPVPAALLGRLAVDGSMQGQGLGAFLLMDALHRVLLASQTLAVHAMVVEARDDSAAAFCGKYGLVPFVDDARHLMLPMATLRQLVVH
ncbi:GNAT family N-acetyltransferase [Variovorax defluvii]|uniref:GNAT family N-acetyltransferase n=1 Tax=Variovorax defluvii TaxID=913761 RepID=A0ABP8I1I0_9BURK